MPTYHKHPLDLPFAECVEHLGTLYLSGQMGTAGAMALVPGGIAAETHQTMENIKAVLEKHGSSMDRILKVTVMLADMSEWAAMNAVYLTYFQDHLPARSAFGASGLALGGRVEIEVTALK
jgi:reactive intermediate/imine deaminase